MQEEIQGQLLPAIFKSESILLPTNYIQLARQNPEEFDYLTQSTSKNIKKQKVVVCPYEIEQVVGKICCIGQVIKAVTDSQGCFYINFVGISRCRVLEIYKKKANFLIVQEVPDVQSKWNAREQTALQLSLERSILEYLDLLTNGGLKRKADKSYIDLQRLVKSGEFKSNPGFLCDLFINFVVDPMDATTEEQKQIMLSLLNAVEVKERIEIFLKLIEERIQVLRLSSEINQNVSSELEKRQREFLLVQQLEAIKQELAKLNPSQHGNKDKSAVAQLETRILALALPPDVKERVEMQLSKLKGLPTTHAEYHVLRDYLELIADLPWQSSSNSGGHIDIQRASKVLSDDHFGLEKVKKRILQHLSVEKVRQISKLSDSRQGSSPILLFHGPPGVGKTSLAKSIAKSLGRPFARISLGGVRDESEIRGHRRTYISAMPGRIISTLKLVRVNDPVILLDEIDKMGRDFRGDPAAALLEVLDPNLNESFVDRYLEIPFDLSKIMFIATANDLEGIPDPLLDRLEQIHLKGYSLEEKREICLKHLIPKQEKLTGLDALRIRIDFEESSSALKFLISKYTREGGIRGLERQVASICRHLVHERVEQMDEKELRGVQEAARTIRLDPSQLEAILGKPKFGFLDQIVEEQDCSNPGIAIGLAYSGPGSGSILYIESTRSVGNGKVKFTGNLGKVMRESCLAAFAVFKSKAPLYGLCATDENVMSKWDLFIHIPGGAIPKGEPIRPFTAITGELSLRGRVLAVGGITEKLNAAAASKIQRVILPLDNEQDAKRETNEGLHQLIAVNQIEEAIRHCLPRLHESRHSHQRDIRVEHFENESVSARL